MISPVDYDYRLPPELIAQAPAEPRDAAKLFVYDTATNEVAIDRFWNLPKYLPPKSFLVLNKTKVVPARITMRKSTGGKAGALFLVNEPTEDKRAVHIICDRRLTPGEALYFQTGEACAVLEQKENIFVIGLPFERDGLVHYLERHGVTPIPPYIKHTPLSEKELRKRYQSIFAETDANHKGRNPYSHVLQNMRIRSVAAPTASLHFTPRVFRELHRRRIAHEELTLHVGLGTFAPVDETNIRTKKLHEEYFDITPETACAISEQKNAGEKLVAVGTTTVRALESSVIASDKELFWRSGQRSTDIFIYPPHTFHAVDALVTNFHVPQSSLMMLVDAFLRHKGAKRHILDLYELAIKEKFRFFSFGDAMLVL